VGDLNAYGELLSPQMREVWPTLAQATARLKGSLVGGTALTIYLRHRQSFDLDFLTYEGFSGEHLWRKLKVLSESSGWACDKQRAEADSMHALVNGVVVQVFRPEARGSNPGYVQELHRPLMVDGMRVASLPDLLATKLDVIMYRPKLRDYIDIAAIDKSGKYRIEDGLRFHMQRYGISATSRSPEQILRLLERPGKLESDRVFGDLEDETREYLRMRALQARAASDVWRVNVNPLMLKEDRDGLGSPAPSVPDRQETCGVWMPKARAYCGLRKHHKGHHRRKRKP
jgi:hypothetical protein